MKIISNDINEILNLENEAKKARAIAIKRIQNLQDKIENGKATTRNKIKDFSIINFWGFKKPEQELKNLEKKIHENQEKQILVIRETKIHYPGAMDPYKSYLMPPPGRTESDIKEKLGIIKGELDFNLKEREILIPTLRYVENNKGYGWRLNQGLIKIPVYEFIYLSEKLMQEITQIHPQILGMPDVKESLKILIGDRKVRLHYTSGKIVDKNYINILKQLIIS